MDISATLLADSIAPNGIRITTVELHYHRYILPELNTHRAFSRNGASSRAIPTAKLIEACLAEQVEPLEWGLNQSGMQAFTVADPTLEAEGREIWNEARADAIKHASRLFDKGFAKQIVNRVLEPYLSTRTVVTSTDWANFDTLRDHKDAQPEIRELARRIIAAKASSTPKLLGINEWHLPYILPEDYEAVLEPGLADVALSVLELLSVNHRQFFPDVPMLLLAMISAARCARVSYRTVEGKPTKIEDDLALFERLIKTQPVHASPTEHQATPWTVPLREAITANYRGFVPFRRLLKNETIYDA